MKLIPISNNILINPERISSIEQKEVRGSKGTYVTYVCVNEKEYVLEIPLQEFMQKLEMADAEPTVQYFAG